MSRFWDPVNVRFCGVCGKQLTAKQKSACCVAHQRVLNSGERHYLWKRDGVTANRGRQRANRIFEQMPDLCEDCEAKPPMDRHHKDGNTANNDPANVAFLCRRCHMKRDGRLGGAPAPRVPDTDLAETVRLYRSGLSMRAVEDVLGLAVSSVAHRLNRAGEPRRTTWETRRLAS